jgi:hypothetical protein
MTALPPRPRALALERAFVGRAYSVRESAFGTASYGTLLRGRGPMGPHTREQAQAAIIIAGLLMGLIARDAAGNLVRTF